eukprot:1158722-Pelagomonas_calceolata.AAC.4
MNLSQYHTGRAGIFVPKMRSHVAKDPKLEGWELYLVDWGYNTEEERARASQHPRIQVISTQQFADLLQK